MSYSINKNGQILFNGVPVVMEENHTSYIDYLEFLNSGGTVIEYNNPEEDLETMISELRLRYSEKISEIPGMREAIERFVIDGTPIDPVIIQKREELKVEYMIILEKIQNEYNLLK